VIFAHPLDCERRIERQPGARLGLLVAEFTYLSWTDGNFCAIRRSFA